MLLCVTKATESSQIVSTSLFKLQALKHQEDWTDPAEREDDGMWRFWDPELSSCLSISDISLCSKERWSMKVRLKAGP